MSCILLGCLIDFVWHWRGCFFCLLYLNVISMVWWGCVWFVSVVCFFVVLLGLFLRLMVFGLLVCMGDLSLCSLFHLWFFFFWVCK